MQQSPLFARAYDLAKETLKVVEAFPRHRRAVLGRQLEESVFAFHAAVTDAARAARKGGAGPAVARAALDTADGALAAHAFALRLSLDSNALSAGRYGGEVPDSSLREAHWFPGELFSDVPPGVHRLGSARRYF